MSYLLPAEHRFDKNLAQHIDIFRQYGEDAMVAKHLCFYIAMKYQTSPSTLFRSFVLDLDEFCKLSGFPRQNLQAKHPNPLHVTRLKDARIYKNTLLEEQTTSKKLIWDSVIENALYRLQFELLEFPVKCLYQHINGETLEKVVLSSLKFLDKIGFQKIRTAKGQIKIVYEFTVAEEFCNNISLYFSKISFDKTAKLRIKNMDDLYVFLANLKQTLFAKVGGKTTEVSTNEVSFEELLKFSQLKYVPGESLVKDIKYKLTKRIEQLNILTDLGVIITYEKAGPNVRYKYQPVLKFVDAGFPAQQTSKEEYEDMLYLNFQKEIIMYLRDGKINSAITDANADQKTLGFLHWKNVSTGEIVRIYKTAQLRTFGQLTRKTLDDAFRVAKALRAAQNPIEVKRILTSKF